MKAKITALLSLLVLPALLLVGCSGGAGKYDTELTGKGTSVSIPLVKEEINSMTAADFESADGQTDYVLIKVRNYGDIVIVLREDIAPTTVKNFKKLVSNSFYDGLIFHRVMEGFMIQGGGMDADYKEKEADSIKGEFTENGFQNNLLHVRGVVSMARTSVPDSASSQFFIMHDSNANLNGKYASFGYVLAGMDVVDAIAECEVTGSADSPRPIENVVIESVRFVQPKAE